jgi:anaerobic ribonucleoside-triphosphate reductase activating protein
MKRTIRLSGIIRESIVDGPGLRYTIFAQGCIHHCEGCHNPATHPFEGGFEASPEAILRDIKKNPLIHGVTFSGGEPFCQAEGFLELAKLLKEAGYNLMTYTGYTYEEMIQTGSETMKELFFLSDYVVDGRFVLAERDLNLKFRGSSNQRIIDTTATKKEGKVILASFL